MVSLSPNNPRGDFNDDTLLHSCRRALGHDAERRNRLPCDAAEPAGGRGDRDHEPDRRRRVAHPLRRNGAAHGRERGMDIRLRGRLQMLAREPRAGRVHPADAFDDRLRAAPQLFPFVSRLVRGTARRGRERLGGRAGRSGQLGLFAHPLRERRAEGPGEERPGGRGHGRAALRHAVAVRPRGEGLRGARERTARVHGRAERALADRRHVVDQAGQGLARRQARRGERQGVRGLRVAQQIPVHRARRGLVRPGTHGRPAEAERLREARDRLCQFQGRGRDPLRERHPAPQEPRRHPRPSRLVGREGREVPSSTFSSRGA